jgi:hypothetical protein
MKAIGLNKMRYECDFVIRYDNGGLEVEEIRGFEAPNLAQAIKWVEEMAKNEPAILLKPTLFTSQGKEQQDPMDWAFLTKAESQRAAINALFWRPRLRSSHLTRRLCP